MINLSLFPKAWIVQIENLRDFGRKRHFTEKRIGVSTKEFGI